jgi:hypothetical protein
MLTDEEKKLIRIYYAMNKAGKKDPYILQAWYEMLMSHSGDRDWNEDASDYILTLDMLTNYNPN